MPTLSKSAVILVLLFSLNTKASDAVVPQEVQGLVTKYCIACHGNDAAEADVNLTSLAELDLSTRLELLNNAHEQLHFSKMPPQDAEQPSDDERQQLIGWIRKELESHNAAKLEDKLRRPEYGNHVDHEKLFSGAYAELPGFTYDRRWLINQYIFENKINRIVGASSGRMGFRGRSVMVGGLPMRVPNMTNPFLLSTGSGVRDYANGSFDGGAVLTMLANTEQIVPRLVFNASRNGRFLPTYSELVALEDEHAAALTRRGDFLRKHIDRVLREVFGDRHEALLPRYVPLELPGPKVGPDGKPVKLLAWDYVKPSHEEALRIYAMQRTFTDAGDSRAAVIDKCQRAWFNEGLDEDSIRRRIKYVADYADDLHKGYERRFEQEYAYRPLDDDGMKIVTDALRKHRANGDTYNQVIDKCMRDWDAKFRRQREAAGPPSDELLGRLVTEMFVKVLEREPTGDERAAFTKLARGYIDKLGRREAFAKLLQTLMLSSEFVYRYEFGAGEADEHGRRMMSPRDAAYAIAYALTEDSPDGQLLKAVADGKLSTQEDYRREVERIVKQRDRYYYLDTFGNASARTESITDIPVRKLRFFRDFFGYYDAHTIFKDYKRFGTSAYANVKGRLIVETDMLVEHTLKQDRDVIETLLTTDKFYVYHSGDNEAMAKMSADRKRIYDHFKDLDWEKFTAEDLRPHAEFFRENPLQGVNADAVAEGKQDIRRFKGALRHLVQYADHGGSVVSFFHNSPSVVRFFNIAETDWDYPTHQPASVPHRKGILTHPAWLLAHAKNTETDPIHRGKWIREKLLAGTVPDVPITVDAVIPEDPHKTLRQRMEIKTGQDYCWKCHKHMDPLGLPFESFDDFGRYRTEESLEYPENLITKTPDKGPIDIRDIYKTLPVDASGKLVGTGDPKLDGEVRDAFDLIDRLARSDRVRQSIIRHAFRFFLGRNETLADSKTLIDADKAYLQSGGSFDAVIVSLLTSDSFIYRKSRAPESHGQ